MTAGITTNYELFKKYPGYEFEVNRYCDIVNTLDLTHYLFYNSNWPREKYDEYKKELDDIAKSIMNEKEAIYNETMLRNETAKLLHFLNHKCTFRDISGYWKKYPGHTDFHFII